MSATSEDIELVKKHITTYPDFPKKGILFRDIFGVLNSPEASKALQSLLSAYCSTFRGKIEGVCALESRGFLFGPQIAAELNVPFVPVRKPGKLPGKIAKISYDLEYGSDNLEIQSDAVSPGMRFLIIDDLLATGGSLAAACQLIASLNGKVEQCLVVMELEELKGRTKIPFPVHSIIKL